MRRWTLGSSQPLTFAPTPRYTTSYQVVRYDVVGDDCLAFSPASVDETTEAV